MFLESKNSSPGKRVVPEFSQEQSLRYHPDKHSCEAILVYSMDTDPNSIEVFLQDFRQTIESATTRLRSLQAASICTAQSPGEWTAKEILGHLIDSAANNHQRFIRAQLSDDLVFAGYEQNSWVELQNYNDESWFDLIQLWSLYNLHLIHLLTQIPRKVLTTERKSHNLDQIAWKTIDRTKPVTLEYFVRDYVGHLEHHLKQIYDRTETAI